MFTVTPEIIYLLTENYKQSNHVWQFSDSNQVHKKLFLTTHLQLIYGWEDLWMCQTLFSLGIEAIKSMYLENKAHIFF